jgi:glycosyltransferase involved in cell wall biosynthesis
LSKFLPRVHAIELNGMRSQRENREVLQLGAVLGIPVISGGDRHGCEANSVFRITIVGDGSEVAWLKRRLKHGEFTGVLRGEELARAYANMDLFVFPSRTDTFGNVVQEAAASSVVTNEGGPKHLVVSGETGLIAETNGEFVARVVELALDRNRLGEMGEAAREKVSGVSWDAAFEKTYTAYRACVPRSARETAVQKNAPGESAR